MAIDRRMLTGVDWPLVGASLVLSVIGVAMIASATQTGRFAGVHVKQLIAIGLGLVALAGSLFVDYRRLADRAPVFFLAASAMLAYVLLLGPRIASTRRWLVLGPLQLQPSELAKVAAALLLAKVFSEARRESLGLTEILGPGAAILGLASLIAAGPDLGTAACLVPMFISVAFLAGMRIRTFFVLALALAVVGGLGWRFALREYQKTRVYSFLDPSLDPRGAGYQSIQSQIAVGSGGFSGKGYAQGTQSQLGYLPARHTDFIFSVLAEEMGFLGVLAALALYLFVLWRCLETAQLARDRIGAFLATGVAATLAFQVVYNVAMVAGLVPVKGLPLPFMSYGGSSMLASFLGVGLVVNVRMRRFVN
jgi:rod shape determining protein RodA